MYDTPTPFSHQKIAVTASIFRVFFKKFTMEYCMTHLIRRNKQVLDQHLIDSML
jgi:hypothetical protein